LIRESEGSRTHWEQAGRPRVSWSLGRPSWMSATALGGAQRTPSRCGRRTASSRPRLRVRSSPRRFLRISIRWRVGGGGLDVLRATLVGRMFLERRLPHPLPTQRNMKTRMRHNQRKQLHDWWTSAPVMRQPTSTQKNAVARAEPAIIPTALLDRLFGSSFTSPPERTGS